MDVLPPATTAGRLRELSQWGTPARDRLQDLLTEPLARLADRVDRLVGSRPEIVRRIAGWRPLDVIPYDCADLPPDLFHGLGDTTPFLPGSEHERAALVEAHLHRRRRLQERVPGVYANITFPDYRDNLLSVLRRRTRIDHDHWREYQAAFQTQKTRNFLTLGDNAAVLTRLRTSNSAEARGVFEHAAGRQRDCVLMTLSSPRSGLHSRVAVGEYGHAHANRLARAGSFLCDVIEQDREFTAEIWRGIEDNRDLIQNHTLRGRYAKGRYDLTESVIVTAQEGVNSILGNVCLATAQRIPGINDAAQAFERVTRDGILDQLALRLSVSVNGTATAFGVFFPDLVRQDGRRLTLARNGLDSLKRIRENTVAILHGKWREFRETGGESRMPDWSGLPCPYAGHHNTADGRNPGAISRLTETLLGIYRCLDPEPGREGLQDHPWAPPAFLPGGQG